MGENSFHGSKDRKWWGWGDANKYFTIKGRTRFISYLKERLNTPLKEEYHPISFEDIKLPNPSLGRNELGSLRRLVGGKFLSTDKMTCISHSMGKSYRDLVRIRKGIVDCPPDAVVYPGSAKEVESILGWATEHAIAVVPFGGGSSVVGGVESRKGDTHRGIISMDMARLNKMVEIDEKSRTARIQTGTPGPLLEEMLNQKGYTLGHFPQSFEYSTLGGWVASRSAGQQSTLYGKIEHMVSSLEMVTPAGRMETLEVPARAAGPDMTQIVVGSEGILGVITEVKVKIHPLSEHKTYMGFFFKDFMSGVEASRTILQEGFVPATLRLSDAEETHFGLCLKPKAEHFGKEILQQGGIWAMDKMGYRSHQRSLMILGFEGKKISTEWASREARRICKEHGAIFLGDSPGRMWYRERFEHPYLRDTLLDNGIMIDTLETSIDWKDLLPLYYAVSNTLKDTIQRTGVPAIVMGHLSHAYPSGSSLYFIFLGKQNLGEELEQWYTIKKAASECILAHGGTISHHHGIGMDHAEWARKEHGKVGLLILDGLKKSLDPAGIMNPGKVI